MKLLIAADMEGISGVVSWNHVSSSHFEYARFRRIMTGDVNAAITGALQGCAEEIVVADGHGSGHNILVEELDVHARLNAGNAAPFSMVQGAASGIDAAIFIGYHARASSPLGVLNHTWDLHIANVWLNDILVGETGLNAAVCGFYGAPLLMVSGDQVLAKEAQELIPGVEAAVVKQATSIFSAECLTPEVSQNLIRKTAANAVERFLRGEGPKPFEVKGPVTVTVEFNGSAHADGAMVFPGAVRLDGRRVQARVADMASAYNTFRTLANLGQR